MKYPNPLRPYKAQIMLGLIFGLLALAGSCFAQTFQCEVSTAGNVTFKFSNTINVFDSTVVFTTNGKSVTLKRLPSTVNVYFTDGVTKSSLLISKNVGTKKGFKHTHQLVIKANIGSNDMPAISYCIIHPPQP